MAFFYNPTEIVGFSRKGLFFPLKCARMNTKTPASARGSERSQKPMNGFVKTLRDIDAIAVPAELPAHISKLPYE